MDHDGGRCKEMREKIDQELEKRVRAKTEKQNITKGNIEDS
jgi:hypothetical protein